MSKSYLNNSRRKTFNECRYKHYLTYELGYQTEPSNAMAFGTAVHSALESYWLAWNDNRAECKSIALSSINLPDPYDAAKARAMVCLYHATWGQRENIRVIGAEVVFTAPLLNPDTDTPHREFEINGRIDLVLDIDGEIVIVEHKTSGEDISIGSTYRQRLLMDSQVSQYLEGYPSATRFIWDVLAKPSIKPLQANTRRKEQETPDEYEIRCIEKLSSEPESYHATFDVSRLESQSERFRRDLWDTAQLISVTRLMGIRDRNESACFARSPCPFWIHCSGMADVNDVARKRRDQ